MAIAGTGLAALFSSENLEETTIKSTIVDLYDENRSGLYSYLVSRGLRPDDAEDAIQESFVRLVEHLRKGLRGTNLRAWLFRVAHNLSMDMHRYSWRFISVGDDDEVQPAYEVLDSSNPEQIYLRMEESLRLQARMSQLPGRQRNSILLRAEGMRYREIAQVLRVSLQRAADLVQKGLERLAVDL